MSLSREFATACRSDLEKIDDLLNRVGRDLESLRAALPVDMPTLGEQLREVESKAVDLRERVKAAAFGLGEASAPEWTDRAGLDLLIADLAGRLSERELEQPRRRLQQLAVDLERGRVLNRRTGTVSAALDPLRACARDEVGRAIEKVPPPSLPGPIDGEPWLAWAWQQGGDALSKLLESLRARLPALAQLIEEVDAVQWHCPSADTTPPATPPPVVEASSSDPADSLPDQHAVLEVTLEPAPPAAVAANTPPEAPPPVPVVTAVVPAPPPIELPPFPEHLRDFRAFSRAWWLSPAQRCEPAPWAQPEFGARLADASAAVLQPQRLAQLWLSCRAAEAIGLEPPVGSRDVSLLADLLERPGSAAAGADADRPDRLRRALGELQLASPDQLAARQTYYRLPTFLEAVRPLREQPLPMSEVGELIELVDLHDAALRTCVEGLLQLGATGVPAVDHLRSKFGAARQQTADELKAALEKARKEFHEQVRRLWSAAGGRIQRTHCRQAWDQFIAKEQELFKRLYPVEHGGQPEWDPDELAARIRDVLQVHRRVAEKGRAKYEDRHTMDRAAEGIAESARTVNAAMRDLRAARATRPEEGTDVVRLIECARKLEASGPLPRPDEELLRQALLRLLAPPTSNPDPLLITEDDVRRHPDLLALLPWRGKEAFEPVSVEETTEPLRATAVWLGTSNPLPEEGGSFLERCVRWARDRERIDLLARLADGLPAKERAAVQKLRTEALYRLTDAGQLRAVWRQLDSLASSQLDLVASVLDEVKRLASEQEECDAPPQLVECWMGKVAEHAARVRDLVVEGYRQEAQALKDGRGPDVLRRLEQGLYAEAVAQLRGRPPERMAIGLRETCWRTQAQKDLRDPPGELARLRASSHLIQTAVQEWRQPGRRYQKLKTEFARMVFVPSGLFYQGNNPFDRFVLPCQEVRRYFASGQLNPCFLPQVGSFQSVVLLSPPVPPDDSAFVQRALSLTSGDRDLHVVLAPRVQAPTRDSLLREFRKRGTAAAVLDDLDFCRLLNVGGRQINMVLGLLEIALEQQRWAARSPFKAPEGLAVAMETYVGRREQARQLSREGTFSRLFSGRKLGKTALLQFIEQTENGKQLPSGLTLRVLYVPVVGISNEAGLVDRVVRTVRERLGFEQGRSLAASTPDELVRFLERFIQQRLQESLLIVLDEADEFVLAQLGEYQRRGTACLSFRMRSEVQAHLDANRLPRVRFVFAGYQATQRSEGAWANWGDVLWLDPLTADDATALIAGPLARLGIDATEQASAIAFRCGYQPAVLLRFGEVLLQQLEKTVGYREGVKVTAEHVAETFRQQTVQDEIRNVVRNNFDRNPFGRAVFFALVLEFARLSPGHGLERAADLVLDRLRRHADGPASEDLFRDDDRRNQVLHRIAEELEDFCRRKLLSDQDREGGKVYRLLFPHHLPVLLAGNPEDEIRQALDGLGQSDNREDHSLLPRRVREDLRAFISQRPEPGMEVRAVVVASHWSEAVSHEGGGVPAQIGIDPLAHAPAARLRANLLAREQLAVLDASADGLDRVLSERPAGLPPPLVTGGADLLRHVLGRARSHAEFYEIAGLGRLGLGVVRWWFQRVRGLNFPAPSDLEWLYRLTSGIPLLVRELDLLLVPPNAGQGGINVTPREVEEARGRMAEAIPRVARELRPGGPPARCLVQREIDLLRMLHIASEADQFNPDANSSEALTDAWELLYAEHFRQVYPDRPVPPPLDVMADADVVEVILRLGLAPTHSQSSEQTPRLGPLPREDALIGLLKNLGDRP